MGDQEHRTLLSQGVTAWNRWRTTSPEIRPDLSGFDIGGENLTGVNFSQADLSGTLLNGTKLNAARLDGTDLSSAELIGADLQRANLRNTSLVRADVCGADLREADLQGADLRETALGSTNLSNADVRMALLDRTMLLEASLLHANFSGTRLSETRFTHSRLSGANFSGARLYDINFAHTDLSQANFQQAFFKHVNLERAVLVEADLSFATLLRANFTDTHFQQTRFTFVSLGWNFFAGVDLAGILDLETVEHLGPSEVSISVFSKSQGQFSPNFFLGAGIPHSVYEQLITSASQSIDSPKCLICSPSTHQLLAQRLQQDLRHERFRCWTTYGDQEPAHTLWYILDGPKDVYDKVIVLFSSSAFTSAMKMFVIMAQEQEKKDQRKVLIGLMTDKEQNAVNLLPPESILDVTSWQVSDEYQHIFQTVLEHIRKRE